ncbi:hypothetical protein E2C01_024524 [Portunus trituberculatus]|uniref:Uncharacterized protein n=1 Tax=Portunus trituberculatus TaxID=210409 RepID=A0A5B7EAI9_PORTR|nr:hypothetical protein [Portunus trituberculatus]
MRNFMKRYSAFVQRLARLASADAGRPLNIKRNPHYLRDDPNMTDESRAARQHFLPRPSSRTLPTIYIEA